jgi:catalase
VLSATDREHLVSNLVGHLKKGVTPEVQDRAIAYWRNVHPDLGDGVARGLGRVAQVVGQR